ncbi:MAG TPA: PepSY domain-containing protein, partial [Candidatus Synoicihabitans sp.]|nr:PepSY domain-containing protein [Candidatus Synoicihabitans sp.]
ASVEPMIAAAQDQLPGHQLRRIAWPTAAGAPVRLLWLDRTAPVWAKFSTTDLDAQTGELLRVRRGREATTKEKWRAIVAPLHFGFYGAPWVKVAYALGGFAPALLALTGTALWWRRTRRRGTAASPRAPAHPVLALDR